MTARPKWVQAIHLFVTDTVIDEAYEYPMDGEDDPILDRIEAAMNGAMCATYGHHVINDQCGIPDHRYCVYCHNGVSAITPGPLDEVEP